VVSSEGCCECAHSKREKKEVKQALFKMKAQIEAFSNLHSFLLSCFMFLFDLSFHISFVCFLFC
jgi:hypothetical protein